MGKISAVKHRRAAFMKWAAHAAVRAFGWSLEGRVPEEPKYVAIFAPHTSDWDAVLGLAIRFGLEDRPASWLLKGTAFRWPFKRLLYWLGAIPIDRTQSLNVVDQVVAIYNQREVMVLGITPEGTRKRMPKWKQGFYHIALKAEVPILMCYVDFGTKTAGIGPLVWPSGDIKEDMRRFAEFYATITPKYPENFGPVWDFESPDAPGPTEEKK